MSEKIFKMGSVEFRQASKDTSDDLIPLIDQLQTILRRNDFNTSMSALFNLFAHGINSASEWDEAAIVRNLDEAYIAFRKKCRIDCILHNEEPKPPKFEEAKKLN